MNNQCEADIEGLDLIAVKVKDAEERLRNAFLLKNLDRDNRTEHRHLGNRRVTQRAALTHNNSPPLKTKNPTCYCFSLSVGGDARNKRPSPLVRHHEGKCMCMCLSEGSGSNSTGMLSYK